LRIGDVQGRFVALLPGDGNVGGGDKTLAGELLLLGLDLLFGVADRLHPRLDFRLTRRSHRPLSE